MHFLSPGHSARTTTWALPILCAAIAQDSKEADAEVLIPWKSGGPGQDLFARLRRTTPPTPLSGLYLQFTTLHLRINGPLSVRPFCKCPKLPGITLMAIQLTVGAPPATTIRFHDNAAIKQVDIKQKDKMRLKVSFAKSHVLVHCPLGWTGPSDVISCNGENNLIKWSMASRGEPSGLLKLPSDFSTTDLHVLASGSNSSGGSAGTGGPGDFLLLASADGRFLIVNSKSNRVEKNILAHSGPVSSVRWSNDSSSFLTAGEDGCVKVWSKAGMLRSTVTQIASAVRFARWAPNSNAILYGSDSYLTVKPLAPNSKVLKWSAHEGLVLCASWCSVNGLIASGGEDCRYKIWDSKTGGLLFQSPMDEHAIVAVEFSPAGDYLLVGSFNVLRLCSTTGALICSSFFNVDNVGSVGNIAWAADGIQFGLQCGNGQVAFGSIVEQRIISRNLSAFLKSRRTIILENIQTKAKDTLEFSDRVTRFELSRGHLVVALASGQVQVFNENYINTPVYVDGRDVRIMELGAKTFLIVDSVGIFIYSYAGRLHLSPRYPGYQNQLQSLSKECISLGANLLAIRDSVTPTVVHIFDHLPGATRQDVPHAFHVPKAVKMVALNRASTVDQFLAVVDEAGDLYISSARSPSEFNPRRIGSQVTHLMWATETNILVTLQGEEETYSVWYCPGDANQVDAQLVTITTETRELAELGSATTKRHANQFQNLRIVSFEGAMVTLGNGIVLGVNTYADMLHRFAQESQWAQCLKICRMAQNYCLWATLAALACCKGRVEVAEEAFSAIPAVDKVEYLAGVRQRGDTGAMQQVQTNILSGRVTEAETQLINNKRIEEAIKLQSAMFNFNRALRVAEDKLPAMKDSVLEAKDSYQKAIQGGN